MTPEHESQESLMTRIAAVMTPEHMALIGEVMTYAVAGYATALRSLAHAAYIVGDSKVTLPRHRSRWAQGGTRMRRKRRGLRVRTAHR